MKADRSRSLSETYMETLDGLRILVIGANGFLGGHLLNRLEQANATILAVSRTSRSSQSRTNWQQGTATDVEFVRGVFAEFRPDVVYHLASSSLGGQEVGYVLPTFEDDLRTTVNVLVAAHDFGVGRLIIMRSCDEALNWEAGRAPQSPYAAAKAAAGLYGRLFHNLFRVPLVMLRPFMTYGPGQKEYKLIPYTTLSMLRGESPKISSGSRRADWIYVSDVISAFLAAATSPHAVGKEIDLATGVMTSVREVVAEIHRLIPGAPPPSYGAIPDRLDEEVRYPALGMARECLGWQPRTSLSEGLAQTIHWYRAYVQENMAAAKH